MGLVGQVHLSPRASLGISLWIPTVVGKKVPRCNEQETVTHRRRFWVTEWPVPFLSTNVWIRLWVKNGNAYIVRGPEFTCLLLLSSYSREDNRLINRVNSDDEAEDRPRDLEILHLAEWLDAAVTPWELFVLMSCEDVAKPFSHNAPLE